MKVHKLLEALPPTALSTVTGGLRIMGSYVDPFVAYTASVLAFCAVAAPTLGKASLANKQ
jgi:hypothetical protein